MTAPYSSPEEEARKKRLEGQDTAIDVNWDPVNQTADNTGPPGQPPPEMRSQPFRPPGGFTTDVVYSGDKAASGTNTQGMTIPSSVPPPPPMPPPPPPELTNLIPKVGDFASDWMSTPNRYLSPLATATRAESEARLGKGEQDAQRKIEEWAAGRGLVGSSYEGDQQMQLQGELDRSRRGEEVDLLQMLANAETLDRERAGQYGLDTVRAGDVMGLDRYKAQLEAAQLAEAQRQFGGTLDLSQQQIDLRAKELMQQESQFGREMSFEEAQAEASRQLTREGMGQQESQFGRTLGLSQQDVDLRAKQLQQQAELEGRSLDIQEARDQATQELQREGMAQQERMFTSEMGQRESEYARSLGLDERQFAEEQSQFAKQYQEQIDSRFQQNDQFTKALASEDARYATDVGLRSRALDLQKEGMDADTAYKQAALEQEKDLSTEALRLQELGINNEDSYRYAALTQDDKFKQLQVDAQNRGMDIEESFRQAELEWDKDRFDQELGFRVDQAETEQDRFEAMMEVWQKYFGDTPKEGEDGAKAKDKEKQDEADQGEMTPEEWKRFIDWLRNKGASGSGDTNPLGGGGGGTGTDGTFEGRGTGDGTAVFTGDEANAAGGPPPLTEEEMRQMLQGQGAVNF